jgi:oxygen-independent coproporphyrinogen-3 oxidase
MTVPSPRPREAPGALDGSPYQAYVYSYPHKTAYAPLTPRVPLAEAWHDERRDALFLYVHVPFCEMRCGFCNLFTTPRPSASLVNAHLAALERQATVVRRALGTGVGFARLAIGGGTPTLLDVPALDRVLGLAQQVVGVDLAHIPGSVETSPETASPETMHVLRAHGIRRVSIGVQSFVEDEAAAVKRPQSNAEVMSALAAIRAAGFPTLNIDLMYGLPGQTMTSWVASLEATLRWMPEEIYLYPLYVRPLTTLGRHPRVWDDERLAMYRAARDRLAAAGYVQASMRMFRAAHAPEDSGPVYCVQEDGMVGLGCGARSYTRRLHYASEYAVGARGVREILDEWVGRSDGDFAHADYGFVLDEREQRRRFVSLTLLAGGVHLAGYRRHFGSELLHDLPWLRELVERQWAEVRGGAFALTAAGVERSDAIGPWLASPTVRERMQAFALR